MCWMTTYDFLTWPYEVDPLFKKKFLVNLSPIISLAISFSSL